MLFCPKCGVAVTKESEFCHKCGQELVMLDKKEEMIPDMEPDSSSTIVINTKEETPPKLYAKSKLVASLCLIGLYPIVVNIHMVPAVCFLIGGIIGLLTHRVKDLGGRQGFSGIIGVVCIIGAFVGIWSIDSIPNMAILVIIVFVFDLPFYLGSRK